VTTSAQDLKEFDTLGTVEGRARRVCENSLKESEESSSGGIVSAVKTLGTDPGEVPNWKEL